LAIRNLFELSNENFDGGISRDKWREFKCHGEAVLMRLSGRLTLQPNGPADCERSRTMIRCRRSQRVGPQPDDAVPGDETVMVPQYFINGKELSSIDFGTGYIAVMGWRKAIN
jgi:hypothetical protein